MELVKLGNEIIRARRELVPKFSPLARLAYRRISNDAEESAHRISAKREK